MKSKKVIEHLKDDIKTFNKEAREDKELIKVLRKKRMKKKKKESCGKKKKS